MPGEELVGPEIFGDDYLGFYETGEPVRPQSRRLVVRALVA
jgi:hypothetical protein